MFNVMVNGVQAALCVASRSKPPRLATQKLYTYGFLKASGLQWSPISMRRTKGRSAPHILSLSIALRLALQTH